MNENASVDLESPASGQHVRLVAEGGWFDGMTGRVVGPAGWGGGGLWTVQIDGKKIRAAAKVNEMKVIR